MRRWMTMAGALVLLTLMTGCPFESTVPLGDPGPGSLDARLAGRWVMTNESGEDASVVFYPFDEGAYYVQLDEKGKPDSTERYRVYTVTIGGEKFLNINKLGEEVEPGAYFFARYDFTKEGALRLRFVGDEKIPKNLAGDRKALVKFVAEHLAGDFLDDTAKPDLMVRPKPAPAKVETAAPKAEAAAPKAD